MATHTYSMAELKLIDSFTDSEVLRKAIPRIDTYYEGVKEMRALRSLGCHGKHTKATGFTSDGRGQFVGTMPVSVFTAILEIDPTFGTDPKRTMEFFRRHPEFVTTEKLP